MSTSYSHISHFKLDTSLMSFSLFIEFQERADPITRWIRPSHDAPPNSIIQTPLLPNQKTRPALLCDQEIPRNLWGPSPAGSTFNSKNLITNKTVSSF
ncbi:hypothetical protein O181_067588 [Austropuccinia psidii MF-1]|uniref:Uncharacterized protein n=1 Tax=Austropuccinia psidii MF-1 TaxID=1389203 RepID=A0A9Q3I4N3_9BASI|nr:hypothetical protein [Austropuccinia psidii MF-1]